MLSVIAALVALHQPIVVLNGVNLAVDTGGDTLVTKQTAALAPRKRLSALGRSDRALLSPQSYLSHWYMTDAITASLGPTWIDRGPTTFDFSRDTVTLDPIPSPSDRASISVAQGYPFVDLAFAGSRYTCLLDTGAVGRSNGALHAVNMLDARAFDALAHSHPSWIVPGEVTIATDAATAPEPQLRMPSVRIGQTTFLAVVFVRREPRTYSDLTKMLGRRVSCDAGGALFAGRAITLDVPRKSLSL